MEMPAQMLVVAMVKEMPARTPEAAAAMEMQGQRRKQM
jgi:hypothetical protein